jgi:hypothetical protein
MRKIRQNDASVIKNGNAYLVTYGPEVDDNEWSESRKDAFVMSEASARVRIQTVKRFFPDAIVAKAN